MVMDTLRIKKERKSASRNQRHGTILAFGSEKRSPSRPRQEEGVIPESVRESGGVARMGVARRAPGAGRRGYGNCLAKSMDEEAKRKGARTQRPTPSNRRGRSASRWRILGRAAGESAGSGHSGGLRFLARLAQGCGRRPPTPANRKESLCVFAFCCSASAQQLPSTMCLDIARVAPPGICPRQERRRRDGARNAAPPNSRTDS